MKREEPKPQHTYRFCHCGRRLRAGERCDETYDGHKPPIQRAKDDEVDARFQEEVVRRDL